MREYLRNFLKDFLRNLLIKGKFRNRTALLAAVLGLALCGCAPGLPGQETAALSREAAEQDGEPLQRTDVTVSDQAAALEQGEQQEAHTLEKLDFLEEGSGFAYRALNEAERIWYRDMEQVLGAMGAEAELSREALEEGLGEADIDRIFQCVINDHPELFFVEGYSYTRYTRYGKPDETLSVEFSGRYSMDPETAGKRREQIRAAADRILEGIDEDAGQYEKVKYVYDTLIRETDYRLDSADNQNIYSVFVNHLSVCQGYAKATQYLLNRLGVECALVLGTVESGEGHAWNLVNIDGSYYYVDPTWGDASYRLEEGAEEIRQTMPEINYDYLNVTTAELLRTHTLDPDQPMPLCTDNAANYYVREGALFESYDREQMQALFGRTLDGGRGDVTIKCADRECYDEIYRALVTERGVFDYLAGSGLSIAYTQNDVQLSLTFWMTNS